MPDLLMMFPFMLASILHYVHQDPSEPSSQAQDRPESEAGFELVIVQKVAMMDAHTTMATGLLRRMADFRDAEDKLQCLRMALVLLSHTHQDADSLLPALQQAIRGVDRARLIRDIQCIEAG